MHVIANRSVLLGASCAALALISLLILSGDAGKAGAAPPENVSKETVHAWMTELSNWGRWGDDDQLGALNLITPAKRKQAARLVREGVSVSLAHDTLKEQAADNNRPFEHQMGESCTDPERGQFCSDAYSVWYHGYAHTHIDALTHMSYEGKHYNGFSRAAIAAAGSPHLAVTNFKTGIFTRGVLMDIPRLKGVGYLEPGTPIYPEDLDAWERQARLKVGSGDAVFIRTGRWALRAENGPWNVSAQSAGLHASAAKWLKARDVAIIGSDAASDVMPSGVEGVAQPIHQLTLIAMGMPIFDNCDLEAVSEEAARQQRWEFLITAAPIPVPGGTGSPLNPVATF